MVLEEFCSWRVRSTVDEQNFRCASFRCYWFLISPLISSTLMMNTADPLCLLIFSKVVVRRWIPFWCILGMETVLDELMCCCDANLFTTPTSFVCTLCCHLLLSELFCSDGWLFCCLKMPDMRAEVWAEVELIGTHPLGHFSHSGNLSGISVLFSFLESFLSMPVVTSAGFILRLLTLISSQKLTDSKHSTWCKRSESDDEWDEQSTGIAMKTVSCALCSFDVDITEIGGFGELQGSPIVLRTRASHSYRLFAGGGRHEICHMALLPKYPVVWAFLPRTAFILLPSVEFQAINNRTLEDQPFHLLLKSPAVWATWSAAFGYFLIVTLVAQFLPIYFYTLLGEEETRSILLADIPFGFVVSKISVPLLFVLFLFKRSSISLCCSYSSKCNLASTRHPARKINTADMRNKVVVMTFHHNDIMQRKLMSV